jgi:imidazoleglycerol phosphate dehydratase HisB
MLNDEQLKNEGLRKDKFQRKTKETDIELYLNIDGNGEYTIDTGIPFFDHMLEQLAKHSNFDVELHAKGDTEVDLHHLIEDTGIVIGHAINKLAGEKKGIKRYGFASVPMDEALVQTTVDFSGRAYFVYHYYCNNDNNDYNKSACGNYNVKNKIAQLSIFNNSGFNDLSNGFNIFNRRSTEKLLNKFVNKQNRTDVGAKNLAQKTNSINNHDSIDSMQSAKSINNSKESKTGLFDLELVYNELVAEIFFYDYVNIFFEALCKNALINLHINIMYGCNYHHITEAVFKACAVSISDALSKTGRNNILSTKGII